MFSDSVSFNGGTRVEVIAVLANCGRDTDRARRALVTWIRHKQEKGRSTEHILNKLRDIESKFIKDVSLHDAFRDARAETHLPRAPDLPLPASVRRRSETLEPPTPFTATSATHNLLPSPFSEHVGQQPSPSARSSRVSHASSHSSEASYGYQSSRYTASPRVVSIGSHPGSPNIPIPRTEHRHPESPVTSSPEDSAITSRRSFHVPSSRLYGLPSPPPEFTVSSPRPKIAHKQSQRTIPVPASPAEESDIIHRRLSTSPGRWRRTPPSSSPPDAPLPPLPKSRPQDHPPTPLHSPLLQPATPSRPLPVQPIPSAVPGSDESEYPFTLSRESSRRNLAESSGSAYPSSEEITRHESMFVAHPLDGRPNRTGTGPPPPYRRDTHSSPDMAMFGESIKKAIMVCGGDAQVQRVVGRCITIQKGYEPPYWQMRLQSAGLNTDAAQYLVGQMTAQTDWSKYGREKWT